MSRPFNSAELNSYMGWGNGLIDEDYKTGKSRGMRKVIRFQHQPPQPIIREAGSKPGTRINKSNRGK